MDVAKDAVGERTAVGVRPYTNCSTLVWQLRYAPQTWPTPPENEPQEKGETHHRIPPKFITYYINVCLTNPSPLQRHRERQLKNRRVR